MAWNRFSDGGLGNHKRRMALFGLVFFLLCTVLASYSFAGVDMKVFGPKRYDRTKGQPNVYTDAFDRCEPSDLALLRVTNGSGKDTSVTAGTISINGTVVVGESDFKQQTLLIEKPVAVSQKNVLRVELKSSSRTGSFVVIELVGKNCDSVAPVVYAPTPADGALLNTPRPAIGASYTDEANGSGIDVASATLTLDGNDVTAAATVSATGVTYLPSADLPAGAHTASLSVRDRSANLTTLFWRFDLDTTAPVLSVASPVADSWVNTPVITASGTVTDTNLRDVSVNGTAATVSGDGFSSGNLSLNEGGNVVTIVASDKAGNQTSVAVPVNLDTEVPALTVSTLSDGSYTNNPTLNISGSTGDNVGVQNLKINGVSVPVNSDGSYSHALTLQNGANRVTVLVIDKAGNEKIDSRTVTLDQTAAVITVTAPADNSKTKVQTIDLAGSVDKEATVQATLQGKPVTVQRDGLKFSASVTADYGANTVEITATDLATNTSTAKRTVIFDDRNPNLSVSEPGQDILTNKAELTLKGSADDQTALKISVTKGEETFTPVLVNGTFEQALTFTEEKSYLITVSATDEVGNVSTVQRNVIYDVTPPELHLNAVTSPTNQASQVITGTREAGAAIAVASATAAVGTVSYPTPTTWSVTVSSLVSDANDITVTATDAAGNAATAAVQIVYDITAPTGSISINNGSSSTGSTGIELDLSSSDASGVSKMRFSSDGVNWTDPTTYTSSVPWTLLAGDGTKQIFVQYLDQAGNWSTTYNDEIVLDTTPPVVSATPAGGIFKTPQTVALSSNETATIYYTTDGSTPTESSPVYSAPVAVAETATLRFFGKDSSGNSSQPASESYTIDTIPPTVTITSPVAGSLTRIGTVSVTGTVSEENCTVTVNGRAAAVTGTSFTVADCPLTEGENTITVQAADRAGNPGAATVRLTLDSTPPDAPVINALTTPTKVAEVTVSGTAERGAAVKVFAGPTFIATVKADGLGNFTLPGVTLAEGGNSFTATATDTAGNESNPSASVSTLLDSKAPVITVTAPVDGSFANSAEIDIKGTVDDAKATVTVNGVKSPLNGSQFQQRVTLTKEANTITVTATDEAGNVASQTLLVTLDTVAPAVSIGSPVSGLVTRSANVTVSGTVSEPGVKLSLNDAPITLNGQNFSAAYALREGENALTVAAVDKAGNSGAATVSVVLDSQAPQVTVTAPAEAAGGANVSIGIDIRDNRGLTLTELRADGVPIWSGGIASAVSESVSYRISPTLGAGSSVLLQAKGIDAAGNEGTGTARINVTQGAAGPGYLQGKVLEEARGLLLAGAEVSITDARGNASSITTAVDGGFFTAAAAGNALVRVSKPGFSTVERFVEVLPEKKAIALDARLTQLSGTPTLVDANGGTVQSALSSSLAAELTIPAGALGAQADVRLTPIGNQGLAGVLPAGWSPLAAADIRLLDPAAGTPVELPPGGTTLKVPFPRGITLSADSVVTVASYDAASHSWKAQGNAVIATDGLSATAGIPVAGQYAFLVADPAPNPPPAAVAGQPIAAPTPVKTDFDTLTASGKVVPQAAPPAAGLKAAGEVVVSAREGGTALLVSGLVLQSRITESFDLNSGDTVSNPAYTQDVILYRTPCVTNIGAGALSDIAGVALRATFPVSPSRDYTIVDLLMGKVGVEIIQPEEGEAGVMVGPDGARLVDADGNVLLVPAGALTQATPVSTANGSAATGTVGSDFILLKAVDVNLTRQTLGASAILSIPAPAGVDPSLPLVVARGIDVKGATRLKLVALARQSGTLISSDGSAAGVALPGITVSGTYYFLQAKGPIGFIAGTVTDASNAPFTGALVKNGNGSLVDLSASTGNYLIAAPVAPFSVTASDLYKGDNGTAAGTIGAANQAVTANLTIRIVPPQVMTVTPAANASNVQPADPVVITFSKVMDKSSITSDSFKLADAAGAAVPGVITFNVDATAVSLYPITPLSSEQRYSVTLSGTAKDLQGYLLGQDVTSSFTVRKTAPPPMPVAGAITGTFPNAEGLITVTGTQGSAEANDTVFIINDSTGEIASVTAGSDGAFTGTIRGQLGDQIKVTLMDRSGNQTVISYITFKGDNGKYLVTAKGGTVEGEGGIILSVPEGSLAGPTVIKVTPVTEQELAATPVPDKGTYLGAVHIDTGGVALLKPVEVSIPLPLGFDTNTPVFVTKPSEIYNPIDKTTEKVYEIIDSTKIVGNRITSACEPFPGVFGETVVFTAFIGVSPIVVSGYAYQERNDTTGYQPNSDGPPDLPTKLASGELKYQFDAPIRGAVIRSPDAWNYVSYTSPSGFYGTFAGMMELPAGFDGGTNCKRYRLTAINAQTMFHKEFESFVCSTSYSVRRIDFPLAEKNTIPPDGSAPVVDVKLDVVEGQPGSPHIVAGTAPVGTKLKLSVSVIDQAMEPSGSNGYGRVTVTTKFEDPARVDTAEYTAIPDTPRGNPAPSGNVDLSAYVGPPPALYQYDYQVKVFPDSSGTEFSADKIGFYTFKVEAVDSAGNRTTRTVQLHTVGSSIDLGQGVEGAPRVDDVYPADKMNSVPVNIQITAHFSEPVQGVERAFKLYDLDDRETQVPADVLVNISGGVMQATLVPKGNLGFSRNYKVVLTGAPDGIKDVVPNTGTDVTTTDKLLYLEEFTTTFRTKEPEGYDLVDGKTFPGRDIDIYSFRDINQEEARYAYVMAGNQGWRVVDITNPKNAEVIYSAYPSCDPQAENCDKSPSAFNYRSVAVHPDNSKGIMAMTENVEFADGTMYGNIRFYDHLYNPPDDLDPSRKPGKPIAFGFERLSENNSGIPGKVVLYGDYAVVATASFSPAQFQIVNIPAAKKRMTGELKETGSAIAGVLDTTEYGSPNDLAIFNERSAVFTTTTGYFLTADLGLPSTAEDIANNRPLFPVILDAYRPDPLRFTRVGTAAGFSYTDNDGQVRTTDLVVAATRQGTIYTVDISNPYSPVLHGPAPEPISDPPVAVRDISVDKAAGLVFVTTFSSIKVYDVKDPLHPKFMNEYRSALNPNSLKDGSTTATTVSFADTQAIVEKDGWVFQANQDKGMVVLDLDMNQPECVGGVNCVYDVERVTHLDQINPATGANFFTDTFVEIPVTVTQKTKVSVALLDDNRELKTVVVPPTELAVPESGRGEYRFVVDYETVKKAGFSSDQLPSYQIRVRYLPMDGSEPYNKFYLGRISERFDSKMLGQTVVHDVLIQDGSLNLSRRDFAFKGRGPQLEFTRTYLNQPSGRRHRPLGNGWSHSLDMRLEAITSDEYTDSSPLPTWVAEKKGRFYPYVEPAKKVWTSVSANGVVFRKVNGEWVPGPGNHSTLTEVQDGFIFTVKDGTAYRYGYPKATDKPAMVQAMADRFGNSMKFQYNDSGQLATVTDAVGRSCSFTYDFMPNLCDPDPSRLRSVTCSGGVQIDLHYNAKGYLERVVRGDKSEQYEYAMEKGVTKGDFNLVKTTDSNNHYYRYDYYGKGELPRDPDSPLILAPQLVVKSVRYPDDGPSATFAYNLDNGTRRVTDPRHNDTVYTLNRFGNPLKIEEGINGGVTPKVTEMTWSIDDKKPDNVMTSLTSRTAEGVYTTTYQYDAKGNVAVETDPLQKSIITVWDQKYSLPTSRKDRNDNTETWVYDDHGALKSYTDGDKATTTYLPLPNGDRESMTSPRGPYVTRYTYDPYGNPETVTEPSVEGPESVTQTTYDVRGRLKESTDPNKNKTIYEYDGLDYPKSVTLAPHASYSLPNGSSATKTTEYDAEGNLKKEVDRAGLTLEYSYTPRNQVESVTRSFSDPMTGNLTTATRSFEYDENGNLTLETDWKNNKEIATRHHYDALNRRDRTTNRLNDTMYMGYDERGNLTLEKDFEGRISEHKYDELNRVKWTSQPHREGASNGEINYTYYNEADPKTNLRTEEDAERYVTTYTYNGRYQRIKRTYGKGDKTIEHGWHYDPAGNLDQEIDEEKRTTVNTYDGRNRLVKVALPQLYTNGKTLFPIVNYQYDAAGNRTFSSDPRDAEVQTEMKYDEWNRLWKVIPPAIPTINTHDTVIELDGEGREVSNTDGNGVVRSYRRDALGQVVDAMDGEANHTVYTYTRNGKVETMTEPNNTLTTNAYDNEDRLQSSKESAQDVPERNITVLLRDKVGNALQVRDFNGNVTDTRYTDLNLPYSVCNTVRGVELCTDTGYYNNGKVKSFTDRNKKTTTYLYDDFSRPWITTDPLGQTVETRYDGVGNVTRVKDKRGILTINTYNSKNLLETRTRKGQKETLLLTNEYDEAGNLVAETDANRNTTRHTYNARNLRDTTTPPAIGAQPGCPVTAAGKPRTFTYDGAGNLFTESDELEKVTTYAYDRENRRKSVEFAGEKTETKYNFFGKPVSIKKPRGNGRVFAYDGFKRLASVTEGGPVVDSAIASGIVTRYQYDANGNMQHEYLPKDDASVVHTEFGYDELNRKTDHIQYSAQGRLFTHYELDGEGNVKSVTDPKGQTITYQYDDINRRTDAIYPANSSPLYSLTKSHTEYDGNNNVMKTVETKETADNSTAIVDVVQNDPYDDLDRLTVSRQRDVTISYSYDDNGNRTGVTSPNGSTSYVFDARNRLTSATTGQQGSTAYCYRADNLRTQINYPNGTRTDYSYFDSKRTKDIINRSGNLLFSSYSYDYDANGNRISQIEQQNGTIWTTTYSPGLDAYGKLIPGYDALDRLLTYTVKDGVDTTRTDYAYEGYNRKKETVTANGEVTSDKTYNYDILNRLMDVTDSKQNRTVTYTYDPNGNTIKKNDSGVSAAYADTYFDYDMLNRLVQAKQGADLLGQYDYDENNLRIRQLYPSRQMVNYYRDGNAVIEERNGSDNNSLLAAYTYADGLLSLTTPNSVGKNVEYYHRDALGSTVNLTGQNGEVEAGYVLSPFGQIAKNFGSSVNRHIFTGKEHDQSTGLVYFGQRYYDPDAARFITEDSYLGNTGTPPSLHRYLYAYSNPTVYIDLYGNDASDVANEIGAGIKKAVTGAYKGTTQAIRQGYSAGKKALKKGYSAGKQAFKKGYSAGKDATVKAVKAIPAINKGVAQLPDKIADSYTPTSTGGQMLATAAHTVGKGAYSGFTLPLELLAETVTFAQDRKRENIPIFGPVGTAIGQTTAEFAENPTVENGARMVGAYSGGVLLAAGGAQAAKLTVESGMPTVKTPLQQTTSGVALTTTELAYDISNWGEYGLPSDGYFARTLTAEQYRALKSGREFEFGGKPTEGYPNGMGFIGSAEEARGLTTVSSYRESLKLDYDPKFVIEFQLKDPSGLQNVLSAPYPEFVYGGKTGAGYSEWNYPGLSSRDIVNPKVRVLE